MSYEIQINEDVVATVIRNLRKYLAEGALFPEHLDRDIPIALAQLNETIEDRKAEIETIRLKEREMIQTKLKRKQFREVEPFRAECQKKIAPLEKKIVSLETIVKEIRGGVQTNGRLSRKLEKQKKSVAIEKQKDVYREQVAFINEYRTPVKLIDVVKELFNCLQGSSVSKGGTRATLAQKIQVLLSMPERHEKLTQLRSELEAADATDGLYDVPKLSKELLESAQYTRKRVASILGYDPQSHRLIFDETGGRVVPVAGPRRPSGGRATALNRERLKEQNETARKQLVAEGLIAK